MINSKITKQKSLRTARLVVSGIIIETLNIINLLKRFSEIHDNRRADYKEAIKNHNLRGFNKKINIELDPYELGKVNGALRDYITLRIANIVDSHPSTKSLKDFPDINISKIREMPQIKEILNARDNWIGHINKRFIRPARKDIICSKEIVDLLNDLQMLICTESVKEK